MLKKITFSIALVSSLALANDTAIYSIPVKGIDPLKSQVGGDIVKFYGKDAAEFMKLLPPVRTVAPYDKITAKHHRNLTLTSKAYSLSFFCEDATIDYADGHDTATPLPQGTACAISLFKTGDDDGDMMDFKTEGGRAAVIRQLQE